MLKETLRALKRRTLTALLRLQWRRPAGVPDANAATPVARLLFIPSDPWTLVGAKGDEAMLQAVAAALRRHTPQLIVGVVTATPAASDAARRLGFVPVSAWSLRLARARRRIDAFAPDAVVVLGADVMDGYYNPVFTTRVLLLADGAARRGARVAILGFSFNDRPSPLLQPVFSRLSRSITVNVRDSVSLARLRAFTDLPARLVADAAFMLEPERSGAAVGRLSEWAARRRDAGDVVLGFNMHPMLIKHASREQVDRLVAAAVSALRVVTAQRACSFVLIPHDYREGIGDGACLARIHRALVGPLDARVELVRGECSAAQLKAIAGLVDGVVTGRMHLAIAALGMGRPVAALTYQDKFQGLFTHFELPQRFLLDPAALLAAGRLEQMMIDFVDSLPALERQVAQHLAGVSALAARNLDGLVPGAHPAGAGSPANAQSPQRLAEELP